MQKQPGHQPVHRFHPKSLDPVIDEILRIFFLLQNEDGSWGIEENSLDRAFSTSWVMKALYHHGYERQILNTAKFFIEMIEKYNYDLKTNFNEIANANFFKGLLNCAFLLKESSLVDVYKFENCIKGLVNELRKRNWTSNEVASYVVIALKELEIERETYDEVKNYIRSQLRVAYRSLQSLTPHICLAIPEEMNEYLHNPNFEAFFQELNDLQAAHIFLALTEIHWTDEKRINELRNNLLSRLRKRQFTEIDRKITKKFLDLALLLRSGHPPLSIKSKIKDKFELVFIKEVFNDKINIDIKFQHFMEDFGYLQLITMASYVIAIKNLGEDSVYLIPKEDYDMVKESFVQETIAIPRKREKWFEFSVFGWAIATNAILILLALKISDILALKVSSQLFLGLKEKIGVSITIFMPYWGIFFRYFCKKFLPTLCKSIEKSDLLRRILLGDSNV